LIHKQTNKEVTDSVKNRTLHSLLHAVVTCGSHADVADISKKVSVSCFTNPSHHALIPSFRTAFMDEHLARSAML